MSSIPRPELNYRGRNEYFGRDGFYHVFPDLPTDPYSRNAEFRWLKELLPQLGPNQRLYRTWLVPPDWGYPPRAFILTKVFVEGIVGPVLQAFVYCAIVCVPPAVGNGGTALTPSLERQGKAQAWTTSKVHATLMYPRPWPPRAVVGNPSSAVH